MLAVGSDLSPAALQGDDGCAEALGRDAGGDAIVGAEPDEEMVVTASAPSMPTKRAPVSARALQQDKRQRCEVNAGTAATHGQAAEEADETLPEEATTSLPAVSSMLAPVGASREQQEPDRPRRPRVLRARFRFPGQ